MKLENEPIAINRTESVTLNREMLKSYLLKKGWVWGGTVYRSLDGKEYLNTEDVQLAIDKLAFISSALSGDVFDKIMDMERNL